MAADGDGETGRGVASGASGDDGRRGAAPADGDLEVISGDGLPFDVKLVDDQYVEVLGHKIYKKQFLAFLQVVRQPHLPIEDRTEYTRVWIWQLRKTPWWKDLYREWAIADQESLELEIRRADEELVEGYRSLVKGKRSDDKSANAFANVFKARLQMNAGGEPLLDNRAQVNVDNRSQTMVNNFGQIDPEKLREFSAEDLQRIARGEMTPKDVFRDAGAE